MAPCPKCAGTRLRRWTDEERIEGMGQDFAAAMSRAHGIIGMAESMAVRRGVEQVERWK